MLKVLFLLGIIKMFDFTKNLIYRIKTMIMPQLMLNIVPHMFLKIIQYNIYKIRKLFSIINIKVMRSIRGTTFNINPEVM